MRARNLHMRGVIVVSCLLFVVLSIVLGPLIWTHDPNKTDLLHKFGGIDRDHLLGTDDFGRDILSRVLHGGRLTLLGGSAVLVGGVLFGFSVGAIAGFAGGRLSSCISWLLDGLLALPTLVVALGIVGVLGKSYGNLVLALILTNWPWFAWTFRGLIRAQRTREYVVAAQAGGVPPWRILWRHIVPNTLGPALVLITTSFGSALLSLTALSFLGLGVQQPEAEWGAMVNGGRNYVQTNSWVMLVPGLAIAVTVLLVNMLGDILRDRLDPRDGDR